MHWPFKKERKIYKSQFNEQVHVAKSFGKKALYAKGIAQSGGEYGHMWQQSFKKLPSDFNPKSCLSLGVGAGTVVNVIRKKYPKTRIVGIEIDPVVLQVARREFGLVEDSKTRIIVDDAVQWLKKNQKIKYDLIVVDLYIGSLNPPKSRMRKFLEQTKKILREDGMIFYNCHYQRDNPKDHELFLDRSKSVFKHVEEVFTYPKNRILLLKD